MQVKAESHWDSAQEFGGFINLYTDKPSANVRAFSNKSNVSASDKIQITATVNNMGGEVASGVIVSLNLTSPTGRSIYDNFTMDSGYEKTLLGNIPPLGSRTVSWNLTVKNAIPETTFSINATYSNTGSTTNSTVILNGNYLSGWDYRKQKNITGSTAGAQTNYQMKLTVYKGSGTDSPGVVYLGGNVRDDFGDIRFTKSDGVTLLDYWIESYTSGVSAVVWVEVDSIPASPNTASIYLYYGNPSAASASNGAATFALYDDFSYTDSPANHGWSTPSGGTWVIDSGALKAWGGNWIYIRKPPASVDIAIAYRAKIGSTADYYSTRFVWNNPGGYGHGYGVDPGKPGNLGTCAAEICMSTDIVAGSGTSDTSWHTFEARRYNGSFESYYDGTSKGTGTSNTYNSNTNLELIFANNNQNSDPNRATWWDDIRVRKYVSPEPTWGA